MLGLLHTRCTHGSFSQSKPGATSIATLLMPATASETRDLTPTAAHLRCVPIRMNLPCTVTDCIAPENAHHIANPENKNTQTHFATENNFPATANQIHKQLFMIYFNL
jgi:hypothetical protein